MATKEELVKSYVDKINSAWIEKGPQIATRIANDVAIAIKDLTYEGGLPVSDSLKAEIAQEVIEGVRSRGFAVKATDNINYLQVVSALSLLIQRMSKK